MNILEACPPHKWCHVPEVAEASGKSEQDVRLAAFSRCDFDYNGILDCVRFSPIPPAPPRMVKISKSNL